MSDKPRTSKVKKLLIAAGIAVPVILIGAYALVPTIASSIAPGKIESAAASAIHGKVKVTGVKTGWSGPTTIEKIELFDDQGKSVGTFSATSSLGIWSFLGSLEDLGTLNLSGELSVVRTVDAKGNATTNFERAVASRGPSAPKAPGASKPLRVKVAATVNKLKLKYAETNASGVVGTSVQMDDLTGSAIVDTLGASSRADVNLAGTFTGSGPSAGGGLKIGVKLNQFLDAQGQLALGKAQIDSNITGTNVPVAMVDALAAQSGMLSGALGDHATFTVTAQGTADKGTASVSLSAPNASAEALLSLDAGKISTQSPAKVSVNSLGFVLDRPEIKKALSDSKLTINGAPRLDATITKLAWPIAAGTDLRGATIDASVNVGAINGSASIEGRGVQRLAISPTQVTIACADPAQGVAVTARTSATLDGQSAGDISADIALAKLVDAQGRLNPSSERTLTGTLSLRGVSAALVQPFVSAQGLPIVVEQDVGPTLDVTLQRTPSAAGEQIGLTVNSKNIKVQAPITLANDRTYSDGFNVRVESIEPLLLRLAQKSSTKIEVFSSGESTVEGSFSMPSKGGAGSLNVNGYIKGLSATIPGETMVAMRGVTFSAVSKPGEPIKVVFSSSAAQGGTPATLMGDLSVSGLMGKTPGKPLAGLGTARVGGQVRIKQLSGPMVESLGRATGVLSDASSATIVRELLGATSELTLDLTQGSGDGQGFALDIRSSNTQAKLAGTLRPSELEIATLSAQADATPALVGQLLKGVNAGATGGAISATGNSKVNLTLAQGVTLPLAKDASGAPTLAIDSAATGTRALQAKLMLDRLVVVGLDPVNRNTSVGAEELKAEAKLPIAMLAAPSDAKSPARAGTFEASVSAKLVRDNAQAGTLTGNFASDSAGQPTGTLKLVNVPTPIIDALAGQAGMVSGALGATASISANLTSTDVTLGLQSPNLTLEGVHIASDDATVRLKSPINCTFDAPQAWVDRFVLGRTVQEPGDFWMGGPVKVQLAVRQLAIAKAKSVPGQASTGMFKPGVFALDADVTIASLPLMVAGTDQRGRRADARATLEGLSAKVQTGSDNSMVIGAKLNKATMGNVVTGEPITLDAKLRQLATSDGQKLDVKGASKDINVKATKVPTQLVQSLMGTGIDLVQVLGPEMNAQIVGTGISSTATGGKLDAQFTSTKASARLAGPVDQGALRVQSTTPLSFSLSEFEYKDQSKFLAIIPLFANINKVRDLTGKVPASVVTSNDLTIPLDGDMRKLNGQLTVDVGQFQYELLSEVGTFFDLGKLKTRGSASVDRFLIDIRSGVATYKDARISLSNIPINNQGSIDLVNNTLDVTTFIPTIGASAGLMGQLSNSLGSSLGKLTGDTLAIPLRTYGPIDNPKREVDFKAIGDSILKQPENIIKGAGGLIDGLFNKPKPKK